MKKLSLLAASVCAGAAMTTMIAAPASASEDIAPKGPLHPCVNVQYAPGGTLMYNTCTHPIRVQAWSQGTAGDCVDIGPAVPGGQHGGPADTGLSRNSDVDKINDC